jgi:hypothetical protein
MSQKILEKITTVYLAKIIFYCINPLNDELNSICHLLAWLVLGARNVLYVSRIGVNPWIREQRIFFNFTELGTVRTHIYKIISSIVFQGSINRIKLVKIYYSYFSFFMQLYRLFEEKETYFRP